MLAQETLISLTPTFNGLWKTRKILAEVTHMRES